MGENVGEKEQDVVSWQIITGDAIEELKKLPDCSVQCVVTSPPYWSLRDYQIEGQYGLEPTPEAHVAKMVEVFREVRRILRDDGTLWLNYGDSYAGSGGAGGDYTEGGLKEGQPKYQGTAKRNQNLASKQATNTGAVWRDGVGKVSGLKPKDLCGIPWRVALALQADGWWLRQDIIWAKPNPMPESVTDRCTKSHEYLFLLAKAAHYYFDAEAIREEATTPYHGNVGYQSGNKNNNIRPDCVSGEQQSNGRNRRSVWTIATNPYKEAHFATFPRKLVEPCIRAGTSNRGCCPKCGMPWERITETTYTPISPTGENEKTLSEEAKAQKQAPGPQGMKYGRATKSVGTLGWQPSCECGLDPVSCTVLDPFSGSGTTGIVALSLLQNYIGIEINPKYVRMSERRIRRIFGMMAEERK